MEKIRHIFFDLDDTLWDFEANSTAVLQEIFRNYELQQKLGAEFSAFYRTYRNINEQLWLKYYKKEIDKTYLRNHRFHLSFLKFGYNSFEENLRITEEYLQRSPHGKLLKEGCIEILDYLQKNYQLHIITNGFREVQNIKIDNAGLRKYFQHVIISEEHALTKPDEEIFRLAEKFTASAPQQCLMVGDNYHSDICGALNAGWNAVWLTPGNTPDEGAAINCISTLAGLRQLL